MTSVENVPASLASKEASSFSSSTNIASATTGSGPAQIVSHHSPQSGSKTPSVADRLDDRVRAIEESVGLLHQYCLDDSMLDEWWRATRDLLRPSLNRRARQEYGARCALLRAESKHADNGVSIFRVIKEEGDAHGGKLHCVI